MTRVPANRSLPASGHRAFTLIELLTVIAIISVLAALLIGSVSRMVDAGRRVKCAQNLASLGKGFTAYMGENEMSLPPKPLTGEGAQDWMVKLDQYVPYSSNVYICPCHTTNLVASTINTNMVTSYAINTYMRDYPSQFPMFRPKISPLFIPNPSKVGLLVDGTSGWLKESQPERLSFVHRGTANVLFLDGHVQTMRKPELVATNGIVACMGQPDKIQ